MLYIDKRFNTARRCNNYNKHTPIDRPSKYMKQKLTKLKGEIDTSTIIFGDFTTPLTIMDGTTRQK